MGKEKAPRPRRANDFGPISHQVAKNVRELREANGRLPARELSERMANLGRPILPSGLAKIEYKERHVDVDDLVALAIALGVTPNRLLLPAVDQGAVELTPQVSADPVQAWKWADGEEPLEGGPQDTEPFRRRSRPEFDRRFDAGHLAVRAAETVASRIAQLAYDDSEDPEISEKTEERITAIQLAMARLQAEVDDLAHAARQVRSDLFGER